MMIFAQYAAFVFPWVLWAWPALLGVLHTERDLADGTRRQETPPAHAGRDAWRGLPPLPLVEAALGGLALAMFMGWGYAEFRWLWLGLGLVTIVAIVALAVGYAIERRVERETGTPLPFRETPRMTVRQKRASRLLTVAVLIFWTYAWRHLFTGFF